MESNGNAEPDIEVAIAESPLIVAGTKHLLVACDKIRLDDVLRDFNDVSKLRNGLFFVPSTLPKSYNETGQFHSVRFKRVREVPRIRKKKSISKSVFAVVSYHFKTSKPKQKKATQRLLRKAIGVKIRPGVVLFPFLRIKDKKNLEKLRELLIGSRRFQVKLEKMGAKVSRWTRLAIVNEDSQTLVHGLVNDTIRTESNAIEQGIRKLVSEFKENIINKRQAKEKLYSLRSRYQELKIRAEAFEKIWGGEYHKILKRIYNLLLKTRKIVLEH